MYASGRYFRNRFLQLFWHLFIDWHWEIFSETIIKFLHIHLQFKCSDNELADLLFWKISTGKKIINFIHWTWFYKLSDFFRAFKKQTNQFWLDIILNVGLRTTRIEYQSWMNRGRKVVSIWIPHWIYQIDNWNQFRW